ncbi:coiled-coil domain-containing protein [Thermoactinospora rubra]|uniref:coiled-coil domain-containing protein n=1 Tax=Thermoactinospora rubra TaxID=1088767 RepID=UPI000A119B9D|nr:hypothetical protein [Thermoactinospora rubra]
MAQGSVRALLAAATAVLLLAAPAHADPKPSLKQLRRELSELQKESDKVIAEYYSSRIALEKAEKADKTARERLAEADAVFARESEWLRRLAVERYTGAEEQTLTMLNGGFEPEALLRRISLNQYLVEQEGARLSGFAAVRDQRAQARAEAGRRAEELRTTLGDLERRKKRAEKLIERIRDKIDLAHEAPGFRRSDGTWVPELPGGPDHITPRMRLVRDLIVERFGKGFGVGCYRPINDGGEHPLGRACDFMLSSGGRMPSREQVERGHKIAAWVVKNARRLGIMYVIYRQRIWHVRTGSWRWMSDRGGTTANHYDHPHVSVY